MMFEMQLENVNISPYSVGQTLKGKPASFMYQIPNVEISNCTNENRWYI